jgi:AbiV family abortive infection protein
MPRWPDLHRFWQAAEANARDLIGDAEILLERERWSRAYALAVLAYEEFGKGLMALALAAAHPSLVTPARLREMKGGHIRKLMSAYEHEAMVGAPELWATVPQSRETAHDANVLKQGGFYVDFSDDGSLRLPSEIGEDEARTLVVRVRKMIHTPGLRSMPFWLPPTLYGQANDQE